MANSLTKVQQIAWEAGCDAFENMNVFANNVEVYKPDSGYAELAGQTIRIPVANQIESSTGLDVSSSISDVSDLTVPITLAASHIKNATFNLNVQESNVDRRTSDNVLASVRKIGSDISKSIADKIIDQGTLWAGETTALTTYNHFASAGTMLSEVEAQSYDKFMYMPSRTAQGLSNELGMRATDNSRDMRAYGAASLPDIAGFQTFDAGLLKKVPVEQNTTIVVNGANQDSDPKAYDSDVTLSAPSIDDSRYQVLNITTTTGEMTDGDIFTIANVFRVGQDSKTVSDKLMTFRVISGGETDAITISPAIIASGAYQNVDSIPASGAAIVSVNTVSAAPTVFTTKGAVRLFASDLNWSSLEDSASVVLDTYTTDSGIQVAFIKQGSALTGVVTHRFSAWCNPNVVEPTKCGGILPSQSTAF